MVFWRRVFQASRPGRRFSSRGGWWNHSDAPMYVFGGCSLTLGSCFLVVPLYQRYCQEWGRGGDYKSADQIVAEVKERLLPPDERRELVSVTFTCGADESMPIDFVPLQNRLDALVGEPTLAFFGAYNRTGRTLKGISTYSVAPAYIASYFEKLQCFCFENQRIKPHEFVELPVLFYVNPDFSEDPNTAEMKELHLHYTFFLVPEGK